jgi:hypothetical protein
MHTVYYDESGDDGYPLYSSPLFVLSAVYCPASDWRENFELLATFRRQLAKDFSMPFKTEFHTHELLLNKRPYRELELSGEERMAIVERHCQIAAQLSIKILTTSVVKPWITSPAFNVLDTALSYSVNRIETDLSQHSENRFIVITDEGRVGKMRHTTRRMQRINFVPSQYGVQPYRRDIKHMIEDPLPKDSKQSYFIQLADMVARLFYLKLGHDTGLVPIPHRYPTGFSAAVAEAYLEILRPTLNLKASTKHPLGLVIAPSPPAT